MTKKRKLPSPRVLRRLLDYDPETGELRWKERPVWMFRNGYHNRVTYARIWNTKNANNAAFTIRSTHGYWRGGIFKRTHYAHRVAWAIFHGEWPPEQIDHVNGIRTDNRIANLRSVSNQENQMNVKKRRDNTSGYTGIRKDKKYEFYTVEISNTYVGCYKKLEDAIEARKQAEARLGFHPNHGR
jgi:hypothetical protein